MVGVICVAVIGLATFGSTMLWGASWPGNGFVWDSASHSWEVWPSRIRVRDTLWM